MTITCPICGAGASLNAAGRLELTHDQARHGVAATAGSGYPADHYAPPMRAPTSAPPRSRREPSASVFGYDPEREE